MPRKTGKVPKPINPILAAISLAVQRIYGSVDNPYTSTITFLMLTWTMHKISMFDRSMVQYAFSSPQPKFAGVSKALPPMPFRWAGVLDVILDCFLISTFLYSGVVIQVENAPSITAVHALEGLLAAVTLNRALIAVHFPVVSPANTET
jgi:hypothetical protein